MLRRMNRLACVAAVIWTACSHGAEPVVNRSPVARKAERDFERSMSLIETPQFPPKELRNGQQGLVVSDVHVDATGHTVEVKVLDATNASFASAAEVALRRSQFVPAAGSSGPLETWGKVTWYFVIRSGTGLVLLPDSVGFADLHRRVAP